MFQDDTTKIAEITEEGQSEQAQQNQQQDKPNLSFRSAVEPDHIILSAGWFAVHVLRKTKDTKNTQHAFLLFEYLDIEKNQLCYERFDLVQDKQFPEKSEVISHEQRTPLRDITNKHKLEKQKNVLQQMFFTSATDSLSEVYIDDIKNCVGKSFLINEDEFKKIKAAVKKDIENPPTYFVSGGQAFFSKSTDRSNTHNCFTWIRDLINDNTRYTIPEEEFDFFVAITSNYLKQKKSSGCGCVVL